MQLCFRLNNNVVFTLWSKKRNKCFNSSSTTQLPFLNMAEQLLVFHFVCPSTSESWTKLATGILGKALLRSEDPTCLCYHSIYHFTRDTTSMCVFVWECSAGPSAFAESGKTGGTTRRREIAGLNQQTAKPHVCVCVCVCVRQRLRMNEITFPITLYSYWL